MDVNAPSGSELDFNINAGGEVKLHERVNGLCGWVEDLDEPLVGPDLEVEASILVDMGGLEDTVDSLLGGKRDGAHGLCIGVPGRVHDLLAGVLYQRHPVGSQLDPDLLLRRHLGRQRIDQMPGPEEQSKKI